MKLCISIPTLFYLLRLDHRFITLVNLAYFIYLTNL